MKVVNSETISGTTNEKHPEYVLLGCSEASELTALVNEHLADGWHLLGNPFGANRGGTYRTLVLYQALTRDSKPTKGKNDQKLGF